MTSTGERLFARYAHAPNALGYCGPATAAGLQRVACGVGDDVDVRRLATQFSGAWPYQMMMAQLAGPDVDPLSEEVGRAYWTGNGLTHDLDARRLGGMLLERFVGQAGGYWSHLTEDLLDEVTPTHAFHVFGVYPWTRLLPTGLPEPLRVLDSCRIRVGEVAEVDADSAVVRTDTLAFEDGVLRLEPVGAERVSRRTADGTFTEELSPGQWVAIHWGFACDVLTEPEKDELLAWTSLQLDRTNPRLAREAGRNVGS